MDKESTLTAAEWNLMECLWERAPRTGREATEYLEEKVGWSRSTTLTMLRRMTEKGLISVGEQGGVKVYFPVLDRQDAVMKQTHEFLDRVYQGSLSLMLHAMTKKQPLSKEEVDELYAILKSSEGGAQDD